MWQRLVGIGLNVVQCIKITVRFHAPSAIILPNCVVVASTLRDISIALAAFFRLGLAGFYGIFMRLLHCFQKHSSQLCPLLGPSAALIIKAASVCFYCSMPSLLRSLEQSYPEDRDLGTVHCSYFDVSFTYILNWKIPNYFSISITQKFEGCIDFFWQKFTSMVSAPWKLTTEGILAYCLDYY